MLSHRFAFAAPLLSALIFVGCAEERLTDQVCVSAADCRFDSSCVNGFCTVVPNTPDPRVEDTSVPDIPPLDASGWDSTSVTLGNRCAIDANCTSGNCECEDFACHSRVCAAADCICGYGTSGVCDNPMTGAADPEDCSDGSTCGTEVGSCISN